MIKKIISSLMIILFAVSSANAAKAKKEKVAEPAKVKHEKAETKVSYTGFEAKREPFALPARLLVRVEKKKVEEKKDVKSVPKVELQGIIWSPKMPQVIVNQKVMRVGDRIEQYQISEITREGMVLFYENNEYTITMPTVSRTGKY